MIHDIDRHIAIINDSLKWAKEFHKESFPTELFKEYRRKLNRIRRALLGNCSAAAYGESQVGKSYLMSSLLSSASHPFVIRNNGRDYSFIDELNPSGGRNSKIESTGVITRFTLRKEPGKAENLIKITNLSVIDIILLLADSYYNDIKNVEVMSYDAINRELEKLTPLWDSKVKHHSVIEEDDIKDIHDYFKQNIGSGAQAVYQSNFAKVVGPVIQFVPYDKWIDIFGLLWNQNPEMNRLFSTLINAYKKIDFKQEVYVPFEAVLQRQGTLLEIKWLDTICGVQIDTGTDVLYTDVCEKDGTIIAPNFSKGELSALIAELTFELPADLAEDRKFLRKMDLLDFPGARSREKYKEREIANVLPKMLRRGKVAYLFNKYSRDMQISSVLFCHHNDQKTEATLGETINDWIENNIGKSPAERTRMLLDTNGIAPLFLVATKFNIDLERTKADKADDLETLDKHWNRFDTVFPEIIKPNRWLEEWIEGSQGSAVPFRNIYPLRDFFYSAKNHLFDGYSDQGGKSPELALHLHEDFPDYFDRLKDSFMRNAFVKKHFANPSAVWNDVATLNNDGSKAIIRNLDAISDVLDNARRTKHLNELQKIKNDIIKSLQVFYEPEDIESKNKKVRLIAGDIRQSLIQKVSTDPAAFGRILDSLMVNPEEIRNIAYDIIVCHTDAPKDFGPVNFIRTLAGIDIKDERAVNIDKLINHFMFANEGELHEYLQSQGFDLDDVISKENHTLSTMGDVITKHIVDYWIETLNGRAKELTEYLPHADEVVFMLINLFLKLGVNRQISEKISKYSEIFSEKEQPNAIGDFAALTLNNFVSSVGRQYMSPDELSSLKSKADTCRIPVDFSTPGLSHAPKRQPLLETLKVFDDSGKLVNQDRIDITVLLKLPFWNNYKRWENLVLIGLIYSSDISRCDPLCNEKVKDMIERTEKLYVNE